MLRIHVLGRVRAWHAGQEIPLGSPQQRSVLTVLALTPGNVIGRGELIDRLWPQGPPTSAANVIHTYIKRLRHVLEPDRPARQASGVLPSIGDGYALRVDPDQTDLGRFRTLAQAARSSTDPTTSLIDALDLWHGPPLDGTGLAEGPLATRLLAEQKRAMTECARAALDRGRAAEVVAMFENATHVHPLDESLAALLITLLLATGNRAGAFAVHQRVRGALAEELGVDPGPELAEAYSALLDDARREPASIVTAGTTLPPCVPEFSGRRSELKELVTRGGTVAITGMAGVGKTELAIRAGQELLDTGRVDRVLFVNLRGFHPSLPPASTGAVLEHFLRLLGVAGEAIPRDIGPRTSLYARQLTGTRTLIVLDNASSEQQIRPLLVDDPQCMTLITSRLAMEGMPRLSLEVFTSEEATELLRRSAGTARIAAEPRAALDIAQATGYLPLALGLAAGRILATPEWTIADHVEPLRRRRHDLRLPSAVQASLDLSYEQLAADSRRLLRLIATHPGEAVDAHAVAALADIDLAAARGGLADLVANTMLLQRRDRYELHDLVRAAALARSLDEDRRTDRQAALTRLFEHYTNWASVAAHTLHPARAPELPPRPNGRFPTSDPDRARAWLSAERQNLLSVIDHAAREGSPAISVRLASALAWDLHCAGHLRDALTVHSTAHSAAVELGDGTGAAHASRLLGITLVRLTRYEDSHEPLSRALSIYRDLGDRRHEAATLHAMAVAIDLLGRCGEAIDLFTAVLDIERELADPIRMSTVLNSLATVCQRTGRNAEALAHLTAALDLECGDPYLTSIMLCNTSELHLLVGDTERAERLGREAVELCRHDGYRVQLVHSLAALGAAEIADSRYDDATRHLDEAIALVDALDARDHGTSAMNHLGVGLRLQGRPHEAEAWHRRALAVAEEFNDHLQQARAHEGLAELAGPDPAHRRQAARIYREMGSAEVHRFDQLPLVEG